MIAIAKKRVNGWNDRYINMTKVAKNLINRQHKGITLLTDERQFLDEYVSLRARYNPGVEAA
jgi:hypothetical protein